MRVGFFPGCLFEYIYTDIGKAIIEVLIKNDIEVVLPKKLECCGIAAFTSGDENTAKNLAMNNVKTFLSYDLDTIITGCASCGSALKNDYRMLLADTGIEIEKFSSKVKDISEFLIESVQYEKKIISDLKSKVTYHDPCHLGRKQKVIAEPRKILKSINKLDFIEMTGAKDCCGGGGSFSLYNYEIAGKIRKRKIEHIEETGAEYIATSCPGCIMHISDGLAQKNSKVKIVHIMELLNKVTK
ncbi:hypothetical protein HY745_03455 [Candidatus Desantisbacteria bacterium]|nr:hypothetical protein [Candidatus Desantisbacteria bacterium]